MNVVIRNRPCHLLGIISVGWFLVGTVCGVLFGQESFRRAARPDWKTSDVDGIFFEDAFTEGLRGPRPPHLGEVKVPDPSDEPGAIPVGDPSTRFAWSHLISATSLEDQVKSLRMELDRSVLHPAQFAAGGYRTARRQFVMLACLFAIIHEYDRDVRWKKDAAAARDRCRQGAQISTTGSLQAFQASKAVRAEIADLVGGNSLVASGEGKDAFWESVADRNVLMQQLEDSFSEVIRPVTSKTRTFLKQQDVLRRNAELSAAIAEILTREGLEDAGDDDYVEYCRRIQRATAEMVRAIQNHSFDAARSAASEIKKACSECHENYRG